MAASTGNVHPNRRNAYRHKARTRGDFHSPVAPPANEGPSRGDASPTPVLEQDAASGAGTDGRAQGFVDAEVLPPQHPRKETAMNTTTFASGTPASTSGLGNAAGFALNLARNVLGSGVGRSALRAGTFFLVRRALPGKLPAPLRNAAALALQGVLLRTVEKAFVGKARGV